MPLVDPWGGTNQGLASLGDTFNTLNIRRRQDIQDTLMAERDRRDAEKDAIGMESARMTLDEQRRKVDNLRAYDEASKNMPTTVPTEVANPDYRPATPQGLNSEMTYAGEGNAVSPAAPAQGSPTMAGSRPMNDSEMNHARINLAFQHGNVDEMAKLGHFIDVTDKIDQRGITKITQLMTAINSVQSTMGSGVALAQGKKMAVEMGMDPAIAEQMVISPQGYVSTPDGQGGTIITMRTPDGKYSVVHSAAKEPKQMTDAGMRYAAAGGDPQARSAINEADQRKESADIRKDSFLQDREARRAAAKGKELGFADKEALRSMGKQLPKSKVLAETAAKNMIKIDRMIALVNSGAGGVRGELLAKVNKVVDVLRVTSPEDAKYNTLKAELRGFAGQLRLQLGLIGQTSDRDVAIMYEAAGGASPAESQKALFSGYRQGYEQDISNYNSDAEAYSQYSSAAKSLYRPITVQTPAKVAVVERRKTKDGKTLEKLSDGTIREVK